MGMGMGMRMRMCMSPMDQTYAAAVTSTLVEASLRSSVIEELSAI